MGRFNKRLLSSAELNKKDAKSSRRRSFYIKAGMIAAAVLLLAFFFFVNRSKSYHSFVLEENAAAWPVSLQNQYVRYREGIIRYNHDGAEAVSYQGTQLWNVSYQMSDPIVDVRGSYAAIADRGNKELIIVDGSGTKSTLTMLHNIIDVSTSEAGITMVVTDDGMQNIWYIYEHGSQTQEDWKDNGGTNVSAHGFILDIAMSPDGIKSLSEYLRIQEDSVFTWSVFHNYGEVGQNYANQTVGGFHNSSFASNVYFLTADNAIVQKDNGFELYYIPEEPEDPVIVDFTEKITQIAYDSTMICVVVENNDEKGRQKVYCYNIHGTKLSEFYMQGQYENIITSGGDIIFYNSTSFYICNRNGVVKMQGEFSKNYKHMYPLNNQDKYILVGDGYLDVLKLTKGESDGM